MSIYLILHLFLLAGGVIWVFLVISIPNEEPKVDFTTRSGDSSASALRETWQRAQMIRPNLSRINARGRAGLVSCLAEARVPVNAAA